MEKILEIMKIQLNNFLQSEQKTAVIISDGEEFKCIFRKTKRLNPVTNKEEPFLDFLHAYVKEEYQNQGLLENFDNYMEPRAFELGYNCASWDTTENLWGFMEKRGYTKTTLNNRTYHYLLNNNKGV